MRIVARSGQRRALQEPERAQAITKRGRGVLNPPITVKDEAAPWVPARHGGVEDAARQAGIATLRERPGQHAARMLIQHHREIPPTLGDAEVRHVADPHLVRCVHRAPANPVRVLPEEARPGVDTITEQYVTEKYSPPPARANAPAARAAWERIRFPVWRKAIHDWLQRLSEGEWAKAARASRAKELDKN